MISIQRATAAEAVLIADIGTRSFMESHGHSGPATDIIAYASSNFSLPAIEAELNDPENIFHIVYFKGQAAGYSKIILNIPHPLVATATATKLERLYLLEEFYGFQLGAALFETIIDLSKKAGQTGIWLLVWMNNERAVHFYKKSGLAIIGSGNFKISDTHANPNYIMYLDYRQTV